MRLGDGTLPSMLGQGPSTGSPPPVGHAFPGGGIGAVAGRFRDGSGSGVFAGLVGARVASVSDGSEEPEVTVTVITGGSAPPPQPASTSRPTTARAARHRRAAVPVPYGSVMVGRLLGTRGTWSPHVHPPAVARRYPTGV
ncbi:hypothetical protein [Streptosporangium sp. LJ11]|uniref:hypothetical protein n=1 Tax=Streptosporangium sp. LJ11 TaxID=3436927 RepID=UPI003F78C2FE